MGPPTPPSPLILLPPPPLRVPSQVPNSRNAGKPTPPGPRSSGGLLTPCLTLFAVQQWRATRTTDWSEWLAVKRTAGAGAKGEVVDVKVKVQRKLAAQAIGVTALLGAAWYLSDPRVARLLEKLRA